MQILKKSFDLAAFPTEQDMRAACTIVCDANPGKPRLKTIAAVGAYDAEIGSDKIDSRRLTGLLAYLLRSGFPIDPEFTTDAVNFSDKRDFLKEDKTADLVFVSFILACYMPGQGRSYSERLHEYAEKSSQPWRVFGLAVSDDHYNGWGKRLRTSAAKMVVTYGGIDEVGTQYLVDQRAKETGLITLLPTSKEHVGRYDISYADRRPDTDSNADIKVIYNDATADLPMPWLGFTATPDYVREIAPVLPDGTLLARRTKALKI